MPTPAEFQSLVDNVTWTYDVTDHGYYITLKGDTLASDKSNALLFFPAAGQGNNDKLDALGDKEGTTQGGGYYWANTACSSVGAYYLVISKLYKLVQGESGFAANPQRFYGKTIRPVAD